MSYLSSPDRPEFYIYLIYYYSQKSIVTFWLKLTFISFRIDQSKLDYIHFKLFWKKTYFHSTVYLSPNFNYHINFNAYYRTLNPQRVHNGEVSNCTFNLPFQANRLRPFGVS